MNVCFVLVRFYFVNESVEFILLHFCVQESSLSMKISFQFYVKNCFSILCLCDMR